MERKAVIIALMIALVAAVSLPLSVEAAKKAPKKIKLSKTKVTMYAGEKCTLKVKVTPSNANKKVIWKSSGKEVAAVSTKGVVKAKKKGSAVINCISKANKKIKAKCRITVKKDPNSSDDEGLLDKTTNILSRTCEPLHLILQGEDPSSESSAQGLTWSVNRNFNGTVKSVEAFVDGVNLSQTYCMYDSPVLTLAGSSDSAMDVRSNLMDGTYNFNSDPDEAIIGWSMWNKDSTKADIEKRFNCKVSDDVYKKLIEFSQSWVVNRAGGSVVVIYGKNDNGVLTARYAGSVTWNMVDNAAVYSFIGVASDNKDAYGKSFSGNAIYK